MTKNKLALLALFTAGFTPLVCCAGTADDSAPPASAAAAAAPAREAQIPFADKSIWNWQVVDDRTLLIQDRGRRWYKATLLGHCINLSFANDLGFESGSSGTFDKFSSIRVRGQRCPLTSLIATTAPLQKTKAKAGDPASATK
jgi:hypothetical protein